MTARLRISLTQVAVVGVLICSSLDAGIEAARACIASAVWYFVLFKACAACGCALMARDTWRAKFTADT